MNKNKKGFTLAEVLITLSILGIVAAVTIPSIHAQYKKAMALSGLKVAYSTLQSVISISEAINGPAEKWDWCLSSDEFTEKYIIPYIQYSKKEKAKWVDPKGGKFFSIKDISGTAFNASGSNWGLGNLKWITLKNGMDIGMMKGGIGNDNIYCFWVDINGLDKGNNIVGKEVFLFGLKITNPNCCTCTTIRRDVRAVFEPGVTYYPDVTYENAFSKDKAGSCNKNVFKSNSVPAGSMCSYVIYKNGWKIPQNYPW